jgi:transposase
MQIGEHFMENILVFIGIDVHKDTHAYCTFFPSTGAYLYEYSSKATTKDALSYINKVKKGIKKETNRECDVVCGYEAGPTGVKLKRDLIKKGIDCRVMAPTTILSPKAGKRVKTDRKDAQDLSEALCKNNYHLAVTLDEDFEAVRDFVRMRSDFKDGLRVKKQQLKSFLLGKGIRYPGTGNTWTIAYIKWIKALEFEHPLAKETCESYMAEVSRLIQKIEELDKRIEELAQGEKFKEPVSKLRCFAGIDTMVALSVVAEIGDFSRFSSAKHFSSYIGLCPGQHSSGLKVKMTGITKAGNSRVRTLLTESANSMARTYTNVKSKRLKSRQSGMSEEIIDYADRGNKRIRYKMNKLKKLGKNHNVAKTAAARELSCFIWGMMTNNIYGEIA